MFIQTLIAEICRLWLFQRH